MTARSRPADNTKTALTPSHEVAPHSFLPVITSVDALSPRALADVPDLEADGRDAVLSLDARYEKLREERVIRLRTPASARRR